MCVKRGSKNVVYTSLWHSVLMVWLCWTKRVGACEDDPAGHLKTAGQTCDVMVQLGCDTDLSAFSEDAPPGSLVKILCPKSCDSCACEDDPAGHLKTAGQTCDVMVQLGCDTDLSAFSDDAPPGSLVKIFCPKSCDTCHEATGNAAKENGFANWPVKAERISCDGGVGPLSPVLESGAVPAWLNGEVLHVAHVNVTWSVFGDVDTMGVTSMSFQSPSKTQATFKPLEGFAWKNACNQESGQPYSPACAVSIVNVAEHVAVQCAMTEMTAIDPVTLEVTHAPLLPQGQLGEGPMGRPGCPALPDGKGYPCPEFTSPEHMIVDTNGDLYNFVYIWKPAAAYRLYMIPAGTTGPRKILGEIPASPHGPMYLHHSLMLTPSFIILIEHAVPMSDTYDWKAMAESYYALAEQGVKPIVRIFDKTDPTKQLGKYDLDTAFYVWHHANAFETDDGLFFDITVYPNGGTMAMFYETLDPLKPSEKGRLMRVSLPHPFKEGFKAEGKVSAILHGGEENAYEFPQTNPRARYQKGSAKWYWVGGSPMKGMPRGAAPQMLDMIAKIDVPGNKTVATWHRAGWSPGEPVFVPRNADQDPNSDDGVVVTHVIDKSAKLRGVILDAATLKELAVLSLPFPQMPGAGLHCLWHPSPSTNGESISSSTNGESISSTAFGFSALWLPWVLLVSTLLSSST